MFYLLKSIPRWIVFQIDILLCIASIFLSYLLRFNFDIPQNYLNGLLFVAPVVIFIKIVFFYFTRTFAGIIKYTSVKDAKRIFKALTIVLLIFITIDFFYYLYTGFLFIPRSILVLDYFLSLLFMAGFRIMVKILYFESKGQESEKINVIIYGAGESGIITKKTLDQDPKTNYNIVAFIDDNKAKSRSTLDDVQIYYSINSLNELIKHKKVNLLIIAIQNISVQHKREIVDTCLSYDIRVRYVPPTDNWINGELSFNQIRNVKIEDILGRAPIKLKNRFVNNEIKNKVVLITGAAGSIGSEMVRQVMNLSPQKLIILDQAESPLYDFELELMDANYHVNFETVLADVRKKDRMEKIFKTFHPDVVFHAAAYKHVPIMELNPSEAVNTNILGTRIIADLSVKYKVKKFVMISTDKAVNPSSAMGASKRIAEIYIQSLDSKINANRIDQDKVATSNHANSKDNGYETENTRFVTTRFGNVLGSNGSVIPRFKKQIAEGGPVTVTHPEITRYFMTIPEACQLVLEAATISNGGEIFLFDMGKSIKVIDLAKKMIKLAGLTLGKDIQLIFTGLRQGEKLYEDLLNEQEKTKPTHHPKIMIANVRQYEFNLISKQITELTKLFSEQDNEAIILKMKQIIPEYLSSNSVYEKLDEIVGS